MPSTGDSLQMRLERYQRRFHVLRVVLQGTSKATSTEEALATFLATVCTGFDWPLGLYCANVTDNGSFGHATIRFPSNGPQLNHVRAFAERPRDDRSALDAEVISQRVPRWIPNVTVEPTFQAAKQAVALGVRGMVAVPITASNHIYGVAEFFTREEFNPSADQVDFLSALGHLVGAAVQFRELDRRIRKIRREQEAVFERLRDPVYIVDRDGRATFVNQPAASLFGCDPGQLVGQDIHTRFHIGTDGASKSPAAECPLHGTPVKTLEGARRIERFRTVRDESVEVEAVAAPFVIDGKEETVIVLRLPWKPDIHGS